MDTLNEMPTEEALQFALKTAMENVSWAVIGITLTYLIVSWVRRSEQKLNSGNNIAESIFIAISNPVYFALPFYTVTRLLTISLSLSQILAWRLPRQFNDLLGGNGEQVCKIMKYATQFSEDVSEFAIIVFLAWAVIRLKNKLISDLQLQLQTSKKGESGGIVLLLDSFKSLSSIAVIICSIAAVFAAFGLSIAPLLTSLGASSLIVGFAAQSLVGNIISGIAIYTSKYFVVGDHIEVISAGGGKVIEGIVELVGPTSCVLRDKEDALVYINNSNITSSLIRNKSQSVIV